MVDDHDAPENFDAYDIIIPSPGIPSYHRVYQTDKVVCELDFVDAFLPEGFTKICVTGTDGKSTTSWILYHILKDAFPKTPVYYTGNTDISLAQTVTQIQENGEKEGYLVIEVSSFMAFAMKRFVSDMTIITNLQPDHLDWHADI